MFHIYTFLSIAEPLTEDDIADILKIIKNAEPKWFDLGIHLGIKSAQLKQFEQTNRAMTEVILYWIENSHEPTWSVLAIALENIDCKSSASSIRSMYTGNTLSNPVLYIYYILYIYIYIYIYYIYIYIYILYIYIYIYI